MHERENSTEWIICHRLSKRQVEIIKAYADNNMNARETSKNIYMSRNNIEYHIREIKRKTGLDVRKFYDLTLLLNKVGGAIKVGDTE